MAKYKVIVSSVWIREDISSSVNVGTLSEGQEVEVSEVLSNWYHISDGWVYGLTSDGSSVFEVVNSTPVNNLRAASNDTSGEEVSTVDPAEAISPSNESSSVTTTLSQDDLSSSYGTNYQTSILKLLDIDEGSEDADVYNEYINSLDGLRIHNLRGIQGMPYQFMSVADTRIDSSSGAFGRKYAEKIVARMPLLLVTPGVPEFLTSYSDAEKQNVLGYALSMMGGQADKLSDIEKLLKREGRYYCLKPDWPAYYSHLNPMASAVARFLNIQDETLFGSTPLDQIQWQDYYNDAIHKKIAYRSSIAFYIHSDTQIQESFSNNTTESQLSSKINGLSDMGREINFLLGTAGAAAGMQFDALKQENLLGNAQNMKDATGKLIGNNSMINSLVNNIATVITGGKLIFPEIWSDSQFTVSYDINMKLTTPDCDKLSWFLNIGMPLLHWIAFAAPRQAGPNGYISPFLLRAFYKGMFNCDMGIVTNLSISKGQEGGWTKDGLPTVVDLSITVKDLYKAMTITSHRSINCGLMNNISLLDYLANMCGVNINEPDIKRTIDMYLTQNITNRVTSAIKLDLAGGLDQWATNKVLNIFRR